eukprot:1747815-Pleurochrysis_carterae.AAC.5
MVAGETSKCGRRCLYTRELVISTETQAHLHIRMAVLRSPRAAEASADAAREGVVPQDPLRPRIGKG